MESNKLGIRRVNPSADNAKLMGPDDGQKVQLDYSTSCVGKQLGDVNA